MIKYIKSLFKKPEPIMHRSANKYRCSCGHMSDLEWCEKCGIRNTSKWLNARSVPYDRYSTTSYTSSNDSSSYYMMNSYSSYSSSGCDSSSSDSSDSGGSCSSGD